MADEEVAVDDSNDDGVPDELDGDENVDNDSVFEDDDNNGVPDEIEEVADES